ncbi:MAG TPA: hypothetical protein VMT85_04025 [Thermoanaerobaculia bacterium]|nr:hypothetical protein [Thermoanaerobaculia bacterium]
MRSSGATLFAIALAAGVAGLLAGLALAPLSPWAPPKQREATEATTADSQDSTAAAAPLPEAADGPAPILRGSLPEPYSALLDSVTLDLDADGADEVVELFAAVEEDEQGRRMWDDGQRWMLRVRETGSSDGEGWVLFDDFVQLGRLSFRAVETTEPSPVLVLELSTGAGVRVWTLRYEPDGDAFVEGSAVAAHGNVVHETPAAID